MKEQNKVINNFHDHTLIVPAQNENVYFNFEEDFVEDNVRCIPMCVRFKLDACGIKVRLREWSKMSVSERNNLAEMKCTTDKDVQNYRNYLKQIIFNKTKNNATELPIERNPLWNNINEIPLPLIQKLQEFNWMISLRQWRELSNLQRFALMKLCQPGHEHKNFPKAVKEFRLV